MDHGVDIFHCGFTDEFRAAGYVSGDTVVAKEIPVDFVNNIKNMEIEGKKSSVVNYLNSNGITLTDYQIEALTLRAYQCGGGGFRNAGGHYPQLGRLELAEAYNKYWTNPTTVDWTGDKFYTKFMFSPSCVGGQINGTNQSNGFINRRRREYYLFVTGEYISREAAGAIDPTYREQGYYNTDY